MSALRWGIAGPGRIAHGIAKDLALLEGSELVAIGSRSQERAAAFAAEHAASGPAGGGIRAHGSYAELIADPEVDVIYVATPHRQHAEIALAAVEAGKALLVEKAFTCTVAGAREVADLALERGVFVMEAMWTRFQPLVVRLRELLADGAIGEVRGVHADLGLVKEIDPADRLWDRAQGGGALLDLGVYPVSFANMVLGAPESVETHGLIGPTGVEQEVGLLLRHENGARALLDCSLRSPLPGAASVHGTTGRIEVLPRFHHPTRMVLHRAGRDAEEIELAQTGGGYFHELVEVAECIAAGRGESAVMPLTDTLDVMTVLETALHSFGLSFEEDRAVL